MTGENGFISLTLHRVSTGRYSWLPHIGNERDCFSFFRKNIVVAERKTWISENAGNVQCVLSACFCQKNALENFVFQGVKRRHDLFSFRCKCAASASKKIMRERESKHC